MMSYFEGIGDEVVVSIASVSILLVALLFWALRDVSSVTLGTPPPPSTHSTSPRASPPEPPYDNTNNEYEASNSETHSNHLPSEEPSADIVSSTSNSLQPEVVLGTPSSNEVTNNSTLDSDDSEEESPAELRQRRLEFFKKSGVEELLSQEIVKSVTNCVSDRAVEPSSLRTQGSGYENATNTMLPDMNTINIRLKYLDDTERNVRSKLDERIKDFKRLHFLEEARVNRSVRLINNGQVLQDLRTLASYGLTDNTVVHVQVLAQQVNDRRSNGGSGEAESELDLGQFLWPILGVLLLGVWVMHFQYREYFTGASTVAMVGLSGLFLTVVWGQYSSSTRTTTTATQ